MSLFAAGRTAIAGINRRGINRIITGAGASAAPAAGTNNTTNHTTTATTTQYDYSIEDAKDDTGVDDKEIVGDDDEVWHYLDNIPEASLGYGWFDNEMALLCQSIDLNSRKFTNSPRPYDKRPADVPAQHPIRAVAKVLDLAPPDSTIRIYCCALSDPFALDLFTHHGGDKTVKIIMQPCDRSVGRIKEFLKRFERVNSYDVFYSRVQLRIADTTQRGCTRYSSMHDERLMTNKNCLVGSYNMTPVARCANWEAMALTETTQQEIDGFDALWETLRGREIENVYPSFYPDTFRVPKRRRES